MPGPAYPLRAAQVSDTGKVIRKVLVLSQVDGVATVKALNGPMAGTVYEVETVKLVIGG